jgi:hypothetical protein
LYNFFVETCVKLLVSQHWIAGSSSDYLIEQADGENEVQRAGDPGELRELHRQEGHHPLGIAFLVFFFCQLIILFQFEQNWLEKMSRLFPIKLHKLFRKILLHL